ncbi:hypothetical protein Glove_390g22 [Diversispora epigaea]|uniref:Uncharacterized protein n=1 Tax=Diversispora epigaea TaxID=1348612 RepID=A0A397H6Q2_9GLOM|nr:hypothetical protein Glove_390g22 [Diversispora epigaea]
MTIFHDQTETIETTEIIINNSDNFAYVKLIEVEKDSEKEKEDKLLQHLFDTYDAYSEKCK